MSRGTFVLCGSFVALALLYFASSVGITSSNDGSHFALTRAFVEGRLAITPDLHFTQRPRNSYVRNRNDISFYRGKYYSDRPPGTAIAALLFYAVGDLHGRIFGRPAPYASEMGVIALPALSGALSAVLTYRIARLLAMSRRAGIAVAITLALGTLLWKYATTLYSHAFSTALILMAVYLAVGLVRTQARESWRYAALGACLGFAVLVEYPNLLLGWLILGYVAVGGALPRQRILPLAGAYGGLALIFPAYNWLAFDDPFSIPYRYQAGFVEDRELATMLSAPLAEGVRGLIFGDSTQLGRYPRAWGLLQTSPILVLAPWGFVLLALRQRLEAGLFTLLFAVGLVVAGRHYSWYGDHDTRYMLTVTPYAVIPLGAWLDSARRWRAAGLVLFAGLLVASIWGSRRMLLIFFHHYAENRGLEPVFRPLLARPKELPSAILPGLGYLDQMAVLLGLAVAVWFVVSYVRRRRDVPAVRSGPGPSAHEFPAERNGLTIG
ncbi:MAG: glycosyltransferase family 39 protein [Chloroflexi bacterium]|nr:glycosyltransferase family 39 protein [Chloroflexota bacterium]